MTRWIILSSLVVAVTLAVTIASQYVPEDVASPVAAARADQEIGPPPSLVIEHDPTFDFGEMSEQTERVHVWPVRNDGLGELRLTLIETSCTCTNVRFGKDGAKLESNQVVVIPPGESRDLYFTWNPREKRGKFSSSARFATNDFENQPTAIFGVQGTVLPSVITMPAALEIAEAPSDEPSSYSLAVFSPSKTDLQIIGTPTTSRGEKLHVSVKPLDADKLQQLEQLDLGAKSGFEVTVEIQPGMPLGRFRDDLIIKTDHPAMPQIDIPITGVVVGPITATPSSVFLPGVSSQSGGQSSLTLSVRGQETTSFEVQTPSAWEGAVQVRVEPIGAASANPEPDASILRQYRLTISIPPGARAGKYNGVIVLKTDHPTAAEVKIPVTGIFVQSS